MTEINFTLPTDDSGDGTSGTPLDRAFFSDFKDAIDEVLHSSTNPTITPADIIDEVVDARGNMDTLEERLEGVIDANGNFIGVSGADTEVTGTAGENLTAGQVVYLSAGSGGKTAGRWYKGDAANAYSSSTAEEIGFAAEAILAGEDGNIIRLGRVTGLAGLTAGTVYYISAVTPGALVSAAPTQARRVGTADSTTSLIISDHPILATSSIAGLIGIGTQTFAGNYTFSGTVIYSTVAVSFTPPPTFSPGTTTVGTMPATVSGGFYKNATVVNSSTGGVANAFSTTVSANTLSADGKTVRFTTYVRSAANGNAKTITATYGGTTIFNSGSFNGSGGVEAFKIIIEITRTGASSQEVTVVMLTPTAPRYQGTTVAVSNASNQTLTLTFAATTANNDLVHLTTIGEAVG